MTPADLMFWPSIMQRDGDRAEAGDMLNAYRNWNERMTATALAGCLGRTLAQSGGGKWPFHRIADGMIQRARKAGFLRWDGRRWHKVEPK